MQFIAGGMEISLIVAVDFTGSNGDPVEQTSLHYIHPDAGKTAEGSFYNEYQRAMMAVGNVLEPYDTDKMFPMFGFGAKVRQSDGHYTACSHCFPLGSGPSHEVAGMMKVT